MNLPKARKTGTTIVGLVYKDGVVLGADTRATEVKLTHLFSNVLQLYIVYLYELILKVTTFLDNEQTLKLRYCYKVKEIKKGKNMVLLIY